MAREIERIPVLVDSREQNPVPLPVDRFDVQRATLPTGDYSLPGLESVFTLERKSLGDAVNTFIHGNLRFRHELNRMSCFDFAAIVIEAEVRDLLEKRYESDAQPAAVMGRLLSYPFDHGVQVLFAGNRPHSIATFERLLGLAWNKWGRNR